MAEHAVEGSAHPSAPAWTQQPSKLLTVGLGASVAHALIMIPGYNEDGNFDTVAWLVMAAISLAVAAVLMLVVVPKYGANVALAAGIVALVSDLAFWAMITAPIAVTAIVMGLRVRDAERGKGTAAIVLGALALVALVAITIGDASSS